MSDIRDSGLWKLLRHTTLSRPDQQQHEPERLNSTKSQRIGSREEHQPRVAHDEQFSRSVRGHAGPAPLWWAWDGMLSSSMYGGNGRDFECLAVVSI